MLGTSPIGSTTFGGSGVPSTVPEVTPPITSLNEGIMQSGGDLYLDPTTGDIALVGNTPVLISDTLSLVRQRIVIRLNTFLGEWFYNSEVGIPYYEQILTQRYDKSIVDSILRSVVLDTEDVVEVTSFETTIDRETRKLNFYIEATTTQGSMTVQI